MRGEILGDQHPTPAEGPEQLVLAITADFNDREELATKLSGGGFQTVYCSDIASLEDLELRAKPAVVLLIASSDAEANADIVQLIQKVLPFIPVVALLQIERVSLAVDLMKCGVKDVLVRPVEAAALCVAIKNLMVDPNERAPLLDRRRFQGITAREFDVLELIVAGQTSKKAADVLGISSRTVELHRHSLMNKLGTRNTAELVRMVTSQILH